MRGKNQANPYCCIVTDTPIPRRDPGSEDAFGHGQVSSEEMDGDAVAETVDDESGHTSTMMESISWMISPTLKNEGRYQGSDQNAVRRRCPPLSPMIMSI